MSTFTDGPAPSVTPGPDAEPSRPRADPAGADRAGADRGAVDESAGTPSARLGLAARGDPAPDRRRPRRHGGPARPPGHGQLHRLGQLRAPALQPDAGPGLGPVTRAAQPGDRTPGRPGPVAPLRAAPPGAPAERPAAPAPVSGGPVTSGRVRNGTAPSSPPRTGPDRSPVRRVDGPGLPSRPARPGDRSRDQRVGREPATNAFASTPQTPAWPPAADRWDAALAPGRAVAGWDVSAVERTTPHDPTAESASSTTRTPTKPPAPASPVALTGPPTGTEAPPPAAPPSRAAAAAAQLAAPPQSPPNLPPRERSLPPTGPAAPRRNGSPAPEPVQVPAQRGPVPAAGGSGTVDAPAGAPPADQPPPEPGSANGAEPAADDLQSRRVRVVLAERKGVARPVRTVVDIQEGTGVGELLRSNLIQSQLAVALRFAVGAGLALGLLPLLFAMFPEIGLIDVFGLRLPWLLLGFLVYPFLLGLGWWHTRTAERVEQEFADHVQDN